MWDRICKRSANWQTNGVSSEKAPDPVAESPARSKASKASVVFALLVLCTIVTSNYPLPFKVTGLLFGLAALVMGVRAVVLLIRAKLGSGIAVVSIMGIVLTAFTVFGIAGQVILWPVQSDYETCQREALTGQAIDACTQEYTTTLENLQERVLRP